MTIRRQLLNFGKSSVDFRIGPDAIENFSRLAGGAVGKPNRVLLMSDGSLDAGRFQTVERSLIDCGFTVNRLDIDSAAPELADTQRVFQALADAGITSDDLVVGVGSTSTVEFAAFCARLWCGGTPCLVLPVALEGMVLAASSATSFDIAGDHGMVAMRSYPTMVVADVGLACADASANLSGYVPVVGALMADSKRSWEHLVENAPRIAKLDEAALIDAVVATQTARRAVINAANPSARAALDYGVTAARALRRCLGGGIPWWRLVSEGMRFEARLAVDAASFDVDRVFEQDDLFFDLGIEEMGFSLEPAPFIEAIKDEASKRANRLLFSLPRAVGTIRLASVDAEVLARHAEAYLQSRAELLQENE